MNISVGNDRFIQTRGEKYVIATTDGHVWNAACETWDAQYRVIREFDTYDDALNYSYRLGKFENDELEWEQRQAADLAERLSVRDDYGQDRAELHDDAVNRPIVQEEN